MPAAITDKFTETTNGTRPVPTTLTALKSVGAASISCAALTGWPTATAVHFIIYTVNTAGAKVAGSQTDWKGIVSGTTITGLVLKAGTDNGYSIGAVVEAAPTAAWADDVTEGMVVEHKQTGAHAAITADSLVATGNVQGASVIATGDMQLRSSSLEGIHNNMIYDHVSSGLVWSGDSYGSTRNASMTAGIVYISGKRIAVSLVTARSFTASKDTYIDIDSTGTPVYTEVTNNAASPALTAGSIRIGIIVTGASNIVAATSINQGQKSRILPIASGFAYTVTDSLGNLICSRDPHRKLLGYAQTLSGTASSGSSETQIAGLRSVVQIPAGRRVKVSLYVAGTVPGAAFGQHATAAWNGTVGSGTQVVRKVYTPISTGSTQTPNGIITGLYDSTGAATDTFNGAVWNDNSGASVTNLNNDIATNPAHIMIELV